MADVYALFWFDVEDCTVPQSDDAAKRLATILTENNVRGAFKVVGQKARLLEQRVRFRVIDALKKQDIGFHSNWHGRRPQIAEYLGPLDWDAGVAEFEKREGPGLEDVRRIFGVNPTTYGQPGSNWGPHVFPVLRKWHIPTYVSGFGYIGLDCQPFWLGGILCTSHMYGKRLNGETQRHLMGLNFELGKPGEFEKHKETFTRSLDQLSKSGGLISIANHPCTLVLEEWFSTYMKPRELTEAGYAHFEQFVKWAISHDNVKTISADGLCRIYPDRASGRLFARDELRKMAADFSGEINFQRLGDVAVSAAEAFGMFAGCLADYLANGTPPSEVRCMALYNPTRRPADSARDVSVSWDVFRCALPSVMWHIGRHRSVPNEVRLGDRVVAPHDYLGALARIVVRLIDGESPPDEVRIEPVVCRFEDAVDEAAARGAWKSSMMPAEFSAPSMIDLAKLEAWTLKPAVLCSST